LAPFKIDDYQVKPLSAKRLAQRVRSLLACNHKNGHASALTGAAESGGAK
jgi:DNA-binding response OmpR family regulator